MTQQDLQHKLKWPITTMMICVIDNPDFAGEIITNFNHGGVTNVKVTHHQNEPPKITERIRKFLEGIFK